MTANCFPLSTRRVLGIFGYLRDDCYRTVVDLNFFRDLHANILEDDRGRIVENFFLGRLDLQPL